MTDGWEKVGTVHLPTVTLADGRRINASDYDAQRDGPIIERWDPNEDESTGLPQQRRVHESNPNAPLKNPKVNADGTLIAEAGFKPECG
jgi:hypothetical protein